MKKWPAFDHTTKSKINNSQQPAHHILVCHKPLNKLKNLNKYE